MVTFSTLEKDDVTPETYQRAYQELLRFANLKVGKIKTIEDLSAQASLIGEDLRRVILADGEIQSISCDYQFKDESRRGIVGTWVIRKPIGDHTIFATASKHNYLTNTGPGGASLNSCKIVDGTQLSLFNIDLPVGEDIGVSGNSIKNLLHVHAVDWRSGEAVSYFPALEPVNKDVQQGFARVLQDGIKDLLQVVEKPTL